MNENVQILEWKKKIDILAEIWIFGRQFYSILRQKCFHPMEQEKELVHNMVVENG